MKHYLHRKSNGYWYVLTKDGTRRVSDVSTRTKKKNEAEEFLKAYRPSGKLSVQVRISDLGRIIDDRLTGTLAEKTIRGYKTAFQELKNIIGDIELSELTQEHAAQWEKNHKKNRAPTTYNTALRSIRAVLHRCGEWYKAYAEACKSFDSLELLRVAEEEKAFMTLEQFRTLLAAEKNVFYRRLFTFAFFTGMRKGEIRNLKWDNIDFGKNLIGVVNTTDFQTKNRKNRYIPIANPLRDVLEEMQKESDNGYVFSRREGKKMSDGNVSYAFARTLKETELD